MKPRILLADDHRIVAEGLRSLLEPEFELVEIVEDGRALVDAAEKLKPDVIITFGRRTNMQLEKVISEMHFPSDSLNIYNCRFPARIPSENTRPPRGKEKNLWRKYILPLTSRIESPRESFVQWRMTKFPGYFLDIAKELNLL